MGYDTLKPLLIFHKLRQQGITALLVSVAVCGKERQDLVCQMVAVVNGDAHAVALGIVALCGAARHDHRAMVL